MKRSVAALLISLVAAAPALAAGKTYGEGVHLDETTPIREILEKPDHWKGKKVRVEGKVTGVCEMKGCWIELQDKDGRALRVKVEDDVIVFPKEAKGLHAAAEGKVQILEMEKEQYVGWMKHMAEEQGRTFDEASIGEAPYRIVQLAGTGAEI